MKPQILNPAKAASRIPFASELAEPAPADPQTLRVVALGGLGEVGRNMTVFEYQSELLIVDCGVLFPEDSQPGIDLILPDFEPIRSRLGQVNALVLTHGHEDHIGAVPYLLAEHPGIPVYGSKLTLALVAAKLREHRVKAELIEVTAGEKVQLGGFTCEFIAVNHSIPDALAVALSTPAGTVLHTGDFKMDQLPLDGRITDLNTIARIAESGVDLLLADSTNAEVPGFVPSERELEPAIEQVFRTARGRIIVASFASHVHRIQQIIQAATEYGRKVAFVGRSMVRNMGIARDLGYMSIPGGTLVTLEELANLPDDEVVLICTGSQGEPMAALSRIANGTHTIKVDFDDTVLLASSLIPGNETSVNRVINALVRRGAAVVHKGNALVHVSGHAAAGELLYLYNIVKPANVMPVHGEWRHQRANAALAAQTGVPVERIVLAGNGDAVDLYEGKARLVGTYPTGDVFVDGKAIGEAAEASLADRRILAEEGFITISVAVNLTQRQILAGPALQARGFSEDPEAFARISRQLHRTVAEAFEQDQLTTVDIARIMRRHVGRWVSQEYRRRPMLVPVVIAADEHAGA